jgi:glycosyltransferase involved in cell wall biosynthesis
MERPFAVELAGYLSAAVGVGEAARRYVTALRSVGVEVLERDVPLPGRDRVDGVHLGDTRPNNRKIDFNLVCLNPEQMLPYFVSADGPVQNGRQTIGIWSWEVDVLPEGWRAARRSLSDLWTYSSFSAKLIEPATGAPVFSIPPPLLVGGTDVKLSIELPSGFRVLVMFDFLSTLERKNPLGAIEAFRRAFRPEDGAVLILKSVNGRHRPERQAELLQASEDRPDIVSIDGTISSEERDALISACDCYLSLHRSEGHGLPLAEAMAMGKPVVATAYGGNTEFMTEDNSYLVACALARVGEGVEHYPADANWAEPDLDDAARLLNTARGDVESGGLRGLRAQKDVQALLAPEIVGAQMRNRLEELLPSRFKRMRPKTRRLAGFWR